MHVLCVVPRGWCQISSWPLCFTYWHRFSSWAQSSLIRTVCLSSLLCISYLCLPRNTWAQGTTPTWLSHALWGNLHAVSQACMAILYLWSHLSRHPPFLGGQSLTKLLIPGLDLEIHIPMLKNLGLQVHTTKPGWKWRLDSPGGGWVKQDASTHLPLSYIKHIDEEHKRSGQSTSSQEAEVGELL